MCEQLHFSDLYLWAYQHHVVTVWHPVPILLHFSLASIFLYEAHKTVHTPV
jgi:hypothetical protein